jgi:glutaredoxin-related protein
MSKGISGIKVIAGFSVATIICVGAMIAKGKPVEQAEITTEGNYYQLDEKKIEAKMAADKAMYNRYLKEAQPSVEVDEWGVDVNISADKKMAAIQNDLNELHVKYAYLKKLETTSALRDSLAFRESSNNPQAVNQFGYVGMFQLGRIAFKDIGRTMREHNHIRQMLPITLTVYPVATQIKDVEKLIGNNKRYLRSVRPFIGKKIKGYRVTENGMLAGAHLCGHVAVKKYLKTGGKVDMKDGNGVKVSTYIKMFA